MPAFDSTTLTKIATLKAAYLANSTPEAHELVKIDWPSPTGSVWYAVQYTPDVASVSPVSYGATTVDPRLIPGGNPAWFVPVSMDGTIGDESVSLTFWDGDEVFSTLMETHGEGIKCSLYYWFPSVTLLLPVWYGHLRFEDEIDVDRVTVKAVQGVRAADAELPWRGHYKECQSPFPPAAGLTTQAQIDEIDCTFNKYSPVNGLIGTNDPSTGLPWTFCPRLNTGNCIERGVDPLRHYSHNTINTTVLNSQTHGPQLYSLSRGNESNLPDSVRTILGRKRVSGMPVMNFRRDYNNNHADQGWWYASYEIGNGPIQSVSQAVIGVGGNNFRVVGQGDTLRHFNYRLGTKGQPAWDGLSSHGYSGTAYIVYNFGYIDPATVNPSDASASAVVEGCNDIRIYTGPTTYTTGYTTNRVWHLLYILTNKRWGYGLDYSRFDIQTWIDAADWADDQVRYTDANGTTWDHIRADCNVELVGRKVAEQINDMCMAGRLSRPFLFNGLICIVPLKAHTSGELAAAPVFTDTAGYVSGLDPNIIWEGGKSTLRVGNRKSDLDLPNRIEATINDEANNWFETPAPPVEDEAAQYRAGRVLGDGTRKINPKQYNLMGVTSRAQAVKMEAAILDLGPNDEGGLQNNLPLKFKIWFIDALTLHPEKVIKVKSPRLTKYGFDYFRVKKIKRLADLKVEIQVQAYNKTYMDAFETSQSLGTGGVCSVDTDCPAGQICVNGVCVSVGSGVCSIDSDCPDGFVCRNGRCVPADICDLEYTGVDYTDGVLTISTRPC